MRCKPVEPTQAKVSFIHRESSPKPKVFQFKEQRDGNTFEKSKGLKEE